MRQFVAIAEEGSFRRAADRLHVSQPPLSVAMQRLEGEIGATLFDRSRHHVKLTAAGRALLDDARGVLDAAAGAVENARRAANGQTGTLAFSFVPSAALAMVPPLLRAFRTACPDVRLRVLGEPSGRQIDALAAGIVDVGLVVPPLPPTRGLTVDPLADEALVLAVPADHPLARISRVQLRSLAGAAFIGLPAREGPGFGHAVLAACRAAGFTPTNVIEAAQMQTILSLVAGGVGIALVPQAMRAIAIDGLVYVRLGQGRADVRYPLALTYRAEDDNPALSAFVAIAKRIAGSRGAIRRRASSAELGRPN